MSFKHPTQTKTTTMKTIRLAAVTLLLAATPLALAVSPATAARRLEAEAARAEYVAARDNAKVEYARAKRACSQRSPDMRAPVSRTRAPPGRALSTARA
jgi:hypothetical protein